MSLWTPAPLVSFCNRQSSGNSGSASRSWRSARENENPAQRAFANHPLRQRDGRNAPVIVADHVDDLRLLRGGEHRLGLFEIQRQRLSHKTCLPFFNAAIAISA